MVIFIVCIESSNSCADVTVGKRSFIDKHKSLKGMRFPDTLWEAIPELRCREEEGSITISCVAESFC